MADDGDQDVPSRFLDFQDRHGLLALHSLWGLALGYGAGAAWIAALALTARDWTTSLQAVAVAIPLLTVAVILRRRKRRHRARLRAEYERWLQEQQKPFGDD